MRHSGQSDGLPAIDLIATHEVATTKTPVGPNAKSQSEKIIW